MCKANRKLEAFRYILTKFVGRQKELTPASSDGEIFSSFSNKRLMKLLYLLCLESVPFDDSDEKGLFEIFDNMIAYPNGPVEQDVYDGLELIPEVKYENGKLVNLSVEYSGSIEPRYREMVNDAFKKLVQHIDEKIFLETERLINIVHSLYLWPKTYVSSSESKSIDVANKSELIKEKQIYDQIVSQIA